MVPSRLGLHFQKYHFMRQRGSVSDEDKKVSIGAEQGGAPLGATARFLGWVPGGPWIFPSIELVSLGGGSFGG